MADVYGRSPTIKSTRSYTKKSSSSGSKSGDEKLAAFKASHSSSGTSTPTIKPMTEEERKANTLISSDVDRANGIDRSKDELQRINEEEAKAEFEANGSPAFVGASIVPGALPDTKSMYPEGDFRNHLNPDKSFIGTVKQKIGAANEKVSSYIPSYEEVIAKRDQLERSNEGFGTKMQLIRDTAHKNERVGSAVDKFATFGKGIYEEVDENPVGVGITTGSMFIGGAALKVGSTAGKMGLLRAASLAGSGSKVGRGLTITTKAIDPAIAVSGVALTGYGLKDKTAEELGHLTPHLAGGLAGGALGWRAASGAALKMEMARGFNARYESPSKLYQVDGPRNAVRPLNSDIAPLESSSRVAANPRTNEIRVIESVRRGGQTIDSNAKFADPINDIRVLNPKDTSIRSEITVFEKGTVKPQKFQFEMEAPKTESVTIQKGRVKSQLEMEVPRPETPLKKVTAKRRNLRVEETTSKKSIWQDETAQLMTKGEVKPATQFERPLFERGYSSEIVPERTMLFNTKMRTPVKTVVPLFSTSQAHQPVFDNEYVKEKDIMKDKVQDMTKKQDTPVYTQVRQTSPLSSSLTTSYSKPKTKERAPGGLARLNMPIPVVDIPTRNKSKRKIKSKKQKDSWKYKRTTNKYKSPLDVKVKGGLI